MTTHNLQPITASMSPRHTAALSMLLEGGPWTPGQVLRHVHAVEQLASAIGLTPAEIVTAIIEAKERKEQK